MHSEIRDWGKAVDIVEKKLQKVKWGARVLT